MIDDADESTGIAPQPDRTQIDDHPLGAVLGIPLGLLATGIYYAAFSGFGTAMLPSKIALAITVSVPCFLMLHYVALLQRRNPFTRLHFWLATTFGPIFIGLVMTSNHVLQVSNRAHAIFLVATFFAYPMSQWMLAHLGGRTAFFHIYLPLKFERAIGKRVTLAH